MIGSMAPAKPNQQSVRILVNGLHSKSGGGVTYLTNMLPLLAADREAEVHVCLHADQRALLSGPIDRVTVHFLDFRTGFWRLLVREQLEVPRLARRIGADVVFSPANYGPLSAPNPVILLRNALGVAFVETRVVKFAYWVLLYLATASSLLTCRRAIAVSAYAKRSAGGGPLRWLGGRVAVVPHGVSAEFTPPGPDEAREGFLLAVSDIYVQKNLMRLLRAVAQLRETRPDIKLKIAGRPQDRAYDAALRQYVRREGLEENVEFLGHVAPGDLAGLYRRCAVFVFPSTVETFGNPLLEAMASGAPIASSDRAAMPEIAGGGAVYFDPTDADSIATALARLLDDAALRRDVAEKATRRAAGFSWEKTARATLAVLKDAAAG